MVIQLEIKLENLNSAYRPGDNVTGHIILVNTSTRSMKFEGLEMDIIGEEYVHWEHKNISSRLVDLLPIILRKSLQHTTKTYEDGAFFINKTKPILGKSVINPGTQRTFPFQFLIPEESPSTYKSDTFNGQISYKISTKLLTNGGGTMEAICDNVDNFLSVIGELDLNSYPVSSPINIKKKSKNEDYGFKLVLPKQGFVPGESLHFTVKMYLDPKYKFKRHKSPTISLVRTEYLISPSIGKKSRVDEKIILQKSLPIVAKWEDKLHIPLNLDVTNLGGSKYIRISYYLQVKAFGLKNLPVIPIIIGTIPVIPDNNNFTTSAKSVH